MKTLLAAAAVSVAALSAGGCASVAPDRTSLEIAMGANVTRHMPWSHGQDGGFGGPTDTVRLTVRQELGNRAFCAYNHISHLSAGWPVNDRAEDWLDMVECGIRFGGK